MGSADRSKKKPQLWKKAAVQFLICFVMGFFIGFAPTSRSSLPSPSYQPELAPVPMERLQNSSSSQMGNMINRNLAEETETKLAANQSSTTVNNVHDHEGSFSRSPERLVIVITPTSYRDRLRATLLRRLAITLNLVRPPLLWIVVESEMEDRSVSELLRKTGVMYRHLVLKENISDPRVEGDHQRNLALSHIEHHRLSGIVHFAGLENVYDLSFFDEIRAIEVFGTWPLAKLSTRRKKPVIEGPVCSSSQVVGWHLKNLNNQTLEEHPDHISGFAFNSSVLWDPERWGRLSSAPDAKQDSLKFVKQAVFEDETKLKGVPEEGCSKVNLWQLHLSSAVTPVDQLTVYLKPN
ncbi:hypothetical protein Ancab_014651 [Ancistrocladus abbreviatus]